MHNALDCLLCVFATESYQSDEAGGSMVLLCLRVKCFPGGIWVKLRIIQTYLRTYPCSILLSRYPLFLVLACPTFRDSAENICSACSDRPHDGL